MTARVPFAPPFDHLIYVRVFEGCNLACQHCFIPANPKRLDFAALARLPEAVRGFAPPGSRILLQWHGGEPTLFGPAWIETAIQTVEAAGPDYRWAHGLQTNLMSYGPAWAQLYHRRFGGMVGVSWDPGIRWAHGGGAASADAVESKFWRAIEQVLADGLTPVMVTTLTRPLMERFGANPMSLFETLSARGIANLHLERLTQTGMARGNWDWLGFDNAAYARAMQRLLRGYLWWRRQREADSLPVMRVSPFDGLIEAMGRMKQALQSHESGYGCWSGRCDTTFHTYDETGYKPGCTALTAELDNPRAMARLDLGSLVAARGPRLASCGSCRFRPICRTGCLAVGFEDGSGECSGARGLLAEVERLAA